MVQFSSEQSHYPQDTDFGDFASIDPNVGSPWHRRRSSPSSGLQGWTPGILQFGISAGPSASARPLVGLPFSGTGLTFTQCTVSLCVHTQGNFVLKALWELRSEIFLTLLGRLATAFSFRLQHNNVVEKIGFML